jgi:hypothetical protein
MAVTHYQRYPSGATACGTKSAAQVTADKEQVTCLRCKATHLLHYENFYLTFGVEYRYEPHPVHPYGVHPDGWVRIMAPDEERARAIALTHYGTYWSRLIPERYFEPRFFPAGEQDVLPANLTDEYPPLSHFSTEEQP